MIPDEESLECPCGFSLGDHDCGRGCSLGSPTLCVSIFDSTSPQMAEKQQNEAREAATKAAAEREAATRAWGEAEAAAFQRVVSEREVGRLLAWPWLQGLVEFLVDMLHVCAAAAVETQQC